MKSKLIGKLIILLILISSCDKKASQNNEYQKPEMSQIKNAGLKPIGNDTIQLNQKAIFRVVVDDPDLQLKKAYFDCYPEGGYKLDSVNFRIKGCEKELFVKDDTIIIQLTPTEVGRKVFHKITAVSIDGDKVLRTHEGNFEYFVSDD